MIATSKEVKASANLRPVPAMFGRRIASLRALHGMGQNDLAKAIGVAQCTVSRWERGEKAPSIRALPAIAEALGCAVEYLIGGPDATSPLSRADEMAKEAAHAA